MSGSAPDPNKQFIATPREQTPGAKMTMIPRELVARAAGAIKGMFAGPNSGPPPRVEPSIGWFNPGQPIQPMAPKADVAGRRLDYPSQYNISIQPRAHHDGITFQQLRALANYDMVRLAIETRKDQMATVTGSVLPRQAVLDELRGKPDARCQRLMDFFQKPDGQNTWDAWVRQIVNEQLEIDAVSLYVRRTLGGDPYALELVNGETIVPKLSLTGRVPLPPNPAYQQILKGMPAVDYTSQELIYAPRNMRVNKYYGFSPVEQIILTVNIAIRRNLQQLNYFTEGNIPEALMSVPKEWTPAMIADYQMVWDAVMANQQARDGRMKFIPSGTMYQATRSDASLFGQFDEWLARVVCYCFSLPPLPFVQQQNRATAETADEAALQQGLGPLMVWFKGLMDRIIQEVFGYTDLEWVWDDLEDLDTKEQSALDLQEVRAGLRSIDEVRAARGLPPFGLDAVVFGVGPLGFMSVKSMIAAINQGLDMPQPAPPPGMMPGAPTMMGHNGGPPLDPNLGDQGQPSSAPPSKPEAVDAALANVSPALLAAVGLGPAGSAGRTVDVSSGDEFNSDPARGSVPHPQVLRTLRMAQRRRGSSSQPLKRGRHS